MRGCVPSFLVLLLTFTVQTPAQDVVSASSGVLQYFEGAVTINDKPVEHKTAIFASLANGDVIRTGKGRAELLLTPGVYLRLDENTSLKMVSNSLAATRLDLTQGSAILDSLNGTSADPIVLTYQTSEVRFPKPGIYRMDSDVGELQAYSGEVAVKHHGNSTTVDSEHRYYFDLDMTTNKSADSATDEFYDWASNRSNVIADQGQMASAEQADAQDADPGAFAGAAPIAPPLYSTNNVPLAPALTYAGSNYAGVGNPFYIYQPYPLFTSGLNLFILPPLRVRPVNTASGYRPMPVINRWPTPVHSVLSTLSPTGLRYPAGISIPRPATIITMPHTVVQHPAPAAPRPPAMPHIAVGHR